MGIVHKKADRLIGFFGTKLQSESGRVWAQLKPQL